MLGMRPSTLSTYTSAMLARGDAKRIPNPADGRSVRLVLTDRGRGVVRTRQPAVHAGAGRARGQPRPAGRRGPRDPARDRRRHRPRRRRAGRSRRHVHEQILRARSILRRPRSPRGRHMTRLHRASAACAAIVLLVAACGGGAPSSAASAAPSTVGSRPRRPARPPRRRRRPAARRSPRRGSPTSPTWSSASRPSTATPSSTRARPGSWRASRRSRRAPASLTDAGFLVAVMDLMGHRDRDGHSGAWAMAQQNGC